MMYFKNYTEVTIDKDSESKITKALGKNMHFKICIRNECPHCIDGKGKDQLHFHAYVFQSWQIQE